MTTQRQKIEQALRNSRCTAFEISLAGRTTCPHKRISELRAEGAPIITGTVKRGKDTLNCYWLDRGRCEECGEWNPPGRAKKFCSASCRAKYHRSRK